MTIEHFNNEEQLSSVRNKINSNFTELDNRATALSAQTSALSAQSGDITTDFTSLTDTPSGFDAGSYLRVNAAGDAIEQVKTAPPDGGLGGNSVIQATSNFDDKLPDWIWVEAPGPAPVCMHLYTITSTTIMYQGWSRNTDAYYATFNNDATGSGAAQNYSWSFLDGATTLQQIIDNGHAVYHGQKSGTSGAGSLSVIKSQAEQFYTELPDAIVVTTSDGYESILRLKYAKNITERPDGLNFYYEARVQLGSLSTGGNNDYFMIFHDDESGTFQGQDGQTDNFPTDGSMDQNLRWFIENGRAIYHGGGASVMPAGSVVQKVVENLTNKQDVSGVGTTLISTQFTPRSTDSKLLLHFTSTFMEDTDSKQRGAFYVDGALATSTMGWDWYNYTSTTNNRFTVTAQATHDNQDLDTKTIAMKLVLDDADRADYHNLHLTVEEITNQPIELETGAPVRGMSAGGGASDFTSLTDTPSGFDAGSYLRVNSTGDAIEQIKTAPPDGGLGGNSAIQAASNFTGKLPDAIVVTDSTGEQEQVLTLQQVYTTNASVQKIIYRFEDFGDNSSDYDRRIVFVNDADGTLSSQYHYTTTQNLRWYIDNGRAIFHGQKSGTSGAGSLSVIKSASDFYTDLPDAIVHSVNSAQFILKLAHIETDYACYRLEDFGDGSTQDRRIYFSNDADGTPNTTLTIFFTALGNLRWYVENGRALYHGHTDSTGSAGTHPEIQNASNFEGMIPDGIIMKRPEMGGVMNYQFNYLNTNYMYFTHWTDASAAASYYARCNNDVTGSGLVALGNNNSQYTTPNGETTLKQLIDNGNVVYHGGRSVDSGGGGVSSVEQLTDVDTTTNPPSAGQVLVYDDTDDKWKPGVQSNEFVDLTDTPTNLLSGAYLRTTADGTAVEQVLTAPPDGGVGGNSAIQADSNFDGKLPDKIVIHDNHGQVTIAPFYAIQSNLIQYVAWTGANSGSNYWASFTNDATGSSATMQDAATGNWSFISGATSLQQIIDNGHAVYHGQKSGTSGAGSLSVIKSQAEQFYTELPDAIVATNGSGYESILRLKFAKNITERPDGSNFYYEARWGSHVSDHIIVFKDDESGTFQGHTGQTDNFPTDGSMDQNLRWFIENGRAIYHGSDDVTSRIGQLEDIKSTVPLANEIDIPDAILGKDHNGELRLYKFTQAHAGFFDYQSNTSGTNYVFTFNSTTGAWTGGSYAVNVTKEHDDIQGYIAAGRALYYGRSGSNLDQLVGDIDDLSDVDTTTNPPSAGQVLVYDDTDDKWKPGVQSNEFVDLTDTPTTLDAGSYLRVNTAGDAVEQIKTAPPDGGVGDQSYIQSASNFANKLPDKLIYTYQDPGSAMVLTLRSINADKIYYSDEWADGAFRVEFSNNETGTWVSSTGSFIVSPISGVTNPSLQQMIDSGNVVYHGQKGGTSGVGSLSYLKTLANSSPNGGFYTELPDAIITESTSDTYVGVFKLHWVKPNSTAGTGVNWEVLYRAEAFDNNLDYHVAFVLDANGTKYQHTGVTHAGTVTRNLRWYIDNGRALYHGGQQDFGVKAWGTFDGTQGSGNSYNITGHTGGNVASIVREHTGVYRVTFINPMPHADYSVSCTGNPWGFGGSTAGVRHTYSNDTSYNATTSSFALEVRDSSNTNSNSNRISFQVVC